MLPALSLFLFVLVAAGAAVSSTDAKDATFRENNQIVVYGTWRASDVICFRRRILRWAESPQIINFYNPTGAIINYVIVEVGTTINGYGGFRADLVRGAIGTNHIRLDVHAEPVWGPFLNDVFIEMRCPATARIKLNELYALASLAPEVLSNQTVAEENLFL